MSTVHTPATLRPLSAYLRFKHTLCLTHRAENIRLGKTTLTFRHKGEDHSVALERLGRVVLLGKPRLDSAVLHRLMREGITIDWLDIFGRPLGHVLSLQAQTRSLAIEQERFCRSPSALSLAREMLLAKIDNAREVLRRKLPIPSCWDACRAKLENAMTLGELRGAEGWGARTYFAQWHGLVQDFAWQGRKAHPAPDPVNVLLSLGYALLHNRLTSALHHEGLNPRQGFFHAGRGRHCALASDLMEPLRPLVDRAVLRLVRRRELQPRHFTSRMGRCTFAGGEAFRKAMHTFEDMFAAPTPTMHNAPYAANSLDDVIGALASNFAHLVHGGLPCPPPRLQPCPAA